jgi:hypothetical protein
MDHEIIRGFSSLYQGDYRRRAGSGNKRKVRENAGYRALNGGGWRVPVWIEVRDYGIVRAEFLSRRLSRCGFTESMGFSPGGTNWDIA